MRLKAILTFLQKKNVDYSKCADKNDVVDLVCELYPDGVPKRTTNEAPTTFEIPIDDLKLAFLLSV